MQVKIKERFDKDIHNILDKNVLDDIISAIDKISAIDNVENAQKTIDITNIKNFLK